MSVFRFKQFEVKHSGSAMKVGTDSVLLGCLANQSQALSILDAGTGTGLLALMMAQRFPAATVDAIEIDKVAYEEAVFNAQHSPWGDSVNIYHQPFQEFANKKQYDLIISNPPYYIGSDNIKIEDLQRSRARHDHELPFEALLSGCFRLLKEEGSCWFILPKQEAETFSTLASVAGLSLHHRVMIKPKPSKEANRVILGFGKTQQQTTERSVTIYNENGRYTQEYFEVTQEFLLWEKGL